MVTRSKRTPNAPLQSWAWNLSRGEFVNLVLHVRAVSVQAIARFKAPAAVEFVDELPKTSTGKIQKFQLREQEWEGQERRVG